MSNENKGLETAMFGVDHGAAPPSNEARAAWEAFHREHEAWLQHRKGKEPKPPEIGLYVAPMPVESGRETAEMSLMDDVPTAVDKAYLPPKTLNVAHEHPTLPRARVALRAEIDPRQQPTTRVERRPNEDGVSSEKEDAQENSEETSETSTEARGKVAARWSEDPSQVPQRLPERTPVRALEPRSAWEKEAPLPGIRPSALPSAHAPATESVVLPMNKSAPKWIWVFGVACGLLGVVASAWLAGWLNNEHEPVVPGSPGMPTGVAATMVSTAVQPQPPEPAVPATAAVEPAAAQASASAPEPSSAPPVPAPTPTETATSAPKPAATPAKTAVPSPPAATTTQPKPSASPAPVPAPTSSGSGIFNGPRF